MYEDLHKETIHGISSAYELIQIGCERFVTMRYWTLGVSKLMTQFSWRVASAGWQDPRIGTVRLAQSITQRTLSSASFSPKHQFYPSPNLRYSILGQIINLGRLIASTDYPFDPRIMGRQSHKKLLQLRTIYGRRAIVRSGTARLFKSLFEQVS